MSTLPYEGKMTSHGIQRQVSFHFGVTAGVGLGCVGFKRSTHCNNTVYRVFVPCAMRRLLYVASINPFDAAKELARPALLLFDERMLAPC